MSIISGTLAEWRNKLRSGDVSPAEMVNQVADAIESHNGETNSYLSFNREAALAEAAKADTSTLLAGMPIAVKDNICVQGEPTRCASKILESFVSPYTATSIELMRKSGGIPLGRMNMDEFAMGSTGENSAFGATLNPRISTRVPGGSSSGSAAAVGAGIALAALGSDTGGSIRQPASHCGVVGLKPTYGRVSRYGLVAFASSLDQIGVLTRTVEDSAIMLGALSGYDVKDSTSINHPVANYEEAIGKDIKGLRIGVPKQYFTSDNHPGVTEALQQSLKRFESLGAELVEMSLPNTEAAVVSVYYVITCAEASSNLSRFDGIRYGRRAENASDIQSIYEQSRAQGLGPEVKRRIILGTYVLSSGYYDAYYTRAQKVRSLISDDFKEAFNKVDLILGPTAPDPAPQLGDADKDHLKTYLSDIYTVPANLTGLPGISLPCGIAQDGDDKLPVGLQLVAPHFREDLLLTAGHAFQQSLGKLW